MLQLKRLFRPENKQKLSDVDSQRSVYHSNSPSKPLKPRSFCISSKSKKVSDNDDLLGNWTQLEELIECTMKEMNAYLHQIERRNDEKKVDI